ncbi:hypothetical protein RvY_06990 [Ramazzottius varieornatus]|uniref:Uncharacterized protein n=1 Tax=Ramazzottius varieornatus TaxID=947166 RepID=A0A1D1V389_RAMVA|nr:hypothetical protein RvY_06990 [Ramazzottius varieornatus]
MKGCFCEAKTQKIIDHKTRFVVAIKLPAEALKLPMQRLNGNMAVSCFHIHNSVITVRRADANCVMNRLKRKLVHNSMRINGIIKWTTKVGNGTVLRSAGLRYCANGMDACRDKGLNGKPTKCDLLREESIQVQLGIWGQGAGAVRAISRGYGRETRHKINPLTIKSS